MWTACGEQPHTTERGTPSTATGVPSEADLTSTARRIVGYPLKAGEDELCAQARSGIELEQGARITAAEPLSVRPGVLVTVNADGFLPGDLVVASLAKPGSGSVTEYLANARVEPNGSVAITIPVPADIANTAVTRLPGGRVVRCLVLVIRSDPEHRAHLLLEYSEP
jgi:hypothetical protein